MHKLLKNLIEMDDYSVQKFNVNEKLPDGYTRLNTIKGITGSAWFDTGVAGNNDNLKIIFKGKKDIRVNYSSFLGNYNNEESNCTRIILDASNGIIAEINRRAASSITSNTTDTTIYHNYEFYKENENTILKVDGNQVDSMPASSGNENNTTIAINSSKINPAPPTAEVYTFFQGPVKFYDGNTLIRKYIPAKRDSDNAIGMYDVVNNNFKISEGTEPFIKGNDI